MRNVGVGFIHYDDGTIDCLGKTKMGRCKKNNYKRMNKEAIWCVFEQDGYCCKSEIKKKEYLYW
jgi:hypothetical protein